MIADAVKASDIGPSGGVREYGRDVNALLNQAASETLEGKDAFAFGSSAMRSIRLHVQASNKWTRGVGEVGQLASSVILAKQLGAAVPQMAQVISHAGVQDTVEGMVRYSRIPSSAR